MRASKLIMDGLPTIWAQSEESTSNQSVAGS